MYKAAFKIPMREEGIGAQTRMLVVKTENERDIE